MQDDYELHHLGTDTFEHLANAIATKTLGAGHSGFAPGPDGGRDGLFVGSAPYPSETDQWSGTWYIQSKFQLPSTSKNPQKWLLDEISKEMAAFAEQNWVFAKSCGKRSGIRAEALAGS